MQAMGAAYHAGSGKEERICETEHTGGHISRVRCGTPRRWGGILMKL